MFEQMEISDQLCEIETPSKNNIWSDANHDSYVRKITGGESTSPTNPEKICAGKCKTNNVVYLSNYMISATNKCLLHGPIHSSEECKVLKEYSKKYAVQQPHKEHEAISGRKTKCGNSVDFGVNVKEVNIMEHDDPIPN